MKLPKKTAAAFNEWQRRYIEDPDSFESMWASIKTTITERSLGKKPSYGALCVATLEHMLEEV